MQISKNAKIVIAAILAILTACGIGFSDNIFKSHAASDLKELSTLSNTEKINADTKIPAEYSFYPDIQWASDGTKITNVSYFGQWDYNDVDTVDDNNQEPVEKIANIVWIDKDNHSYDGKIGAIYDNVGTYNGHTVKLKVTYMGSSENSTSNGFALIMYNNSLGIRTSASPYATTIKYEFFDAETDKPLNVKGYQSFEDIDAYQGLKIENYDKIYYSEAALDNLKVANYGGNLDNLIQSTIDDIDEDTNNIAKIAYTFSGSELTFTWTSSLCYYTNNQPDKKFSMARCFVGLNKDQSIAQALSTYYYVDKDGKVCDPETDGATIRSAVLTLRANSNKIIPSEIKNPIKNVSDVNGDKLLRTSYGKTDTIYFSTIHEVPGETPENYYETYMIKDALAPVLETSVDKVKIYNDATKEDISNKFDIEVSNENGSYVVTATAKNTKQASFYATAYNLVIATTLKDSADLSNYEKDGYYNIPNISNIIVDNNVQDSNEVEVKINKEPTLSIEKNTDKTSYLLNDIAVYTLKVSQTEENTTAKNVVIKDVLDNTNAKIDTNSILIKDKNSKLVDTAQITSDANNKITIKTNADLNYGDYFLITYRVPLTSMDLVGTTINNKAIASSDNTKEAEATAKINVNMPIVYTPDLTIEKSVNDTSFSVGDTAKYTLKVSQTIENATANNVIITDEFDSNLVSPSEIKITDKNGKELTNANINIDKNTFTIETNENLSYGDYFTVTYNIKLSDNKLNNQVLNNNALAKADNASPVMDNVRINLKNPELNIKKTVSKNNAALDDTLTYTIKVTQTVENTIAKNVVITDNFDTSLLKVENVKVVDKNGNQLTNFEYKISATSVDNQNPNTGFTINTNADLAKDDYFVVTYTVKLSDEKLMGTTINNISNASADNAEKVSDNAKVIISKPELNIKKSVNKEKYSIGDKATYTIKVTQPVENAIAKNVVITDTFDSKLVTVESMSITDNNGNEIKNAVIEKTENGFVINTNSDLKSNETITVVYSLSLADKNLANKVLNNLATAKADSIKEVQDNAKITILEPKLSIQKEVNKKIFSTNDKAKYTITVKQTVDGAIAKNVVIRDELDTNLAEAENIQINDKNGNPLNSADIIKTEKGFRIDTNADLSKDDFFTVKYTITLSNSELSGKNIVNAAKATSDNTTPVETTNTITVTKPELAIQKESDKTIYSTGEIAKYTIKITQTVENAVAKNIVITDKFDNENLSKPSNVKVLDSKGNPINNAEIVLADDGFTIYTNSNISKDEYITVTYDISMSNAALSGKEITNIANVKADNADEVSDNNKVTVTTPKLSIKKDVNKTAFSSSETAKYTLVVTQDVENAVAKNVVITDKFDNENIKKPTNIKITDNKGNTLNNEDISVTDTGFTINTNSDLSKDEFFTVTYSVNLSRPELTGATITNTANAKADNADEVSDNAVITIGKPDLTVEKTANKDIYGTDENANYTIKVTQTVKDATAQNIVIKDIFDNKNVNIIKDTIKVKDNDGNNIDGIQIDKIENGYEIKTFTDLNYNESITITYTANLQNDELSGATIKNTATVTTDNTEQKIAEKTINIISPNLVVEKSSDQVAYLVGSTAKYTIKVKQTQENAIAKNVEILDQVENQQAKILFDTIKIVNAKGEVVSGVELTTTNDNAYKIKTNKNLAFNEEFTITYDVDLSNADLNNKDVKNVVQVTSDNTNLIKIEHIIKVSTDKNVVNKINEEAIKNGVIQTGNQLPIKLFMIIGIISVCGIISGIVLKRRK